MTASFDDKGHRPDADHRGERPDYKILRGPEGLHVQLQAWGPHNWAAAIHNKISASWGAYPDTVLDNDNLNESQWRQVEAAFDGKTLPQVLEILTFSFLIDGVTRAETHQHVRTRIGAGYSQHGGRNNDWRHRAFRLPETVNRLMLRDPRFRRRVEVHIAEGRDLYADLVDAGIPIQDARRFLPISTCTYLFAHYNYPALAGFLRNRLEFAMDWEINCVAQLMLREIKTQCPDIFSAKLGSHSDLQKKCAFAYMDMFPPDGKWPAPEDAKDRPRRYPADSNPFWILHPDSMKGGPVEWIPTNGVWPDDVPR